MANNQDRYIGEQKIPYSNTSPTTARSQFLFDRKFLGTENIGQSWKRDILPANFMPDIRNNGLFIAIFTGIVLLMAAIGAFKIKIFGKSLKEYIIPVWHFFLIAVLIVISQYTFVITSGNFDLWGRVTQGAWAIAIILALIKISKTDNFNMGQAFFLGVLFTLVIHGLKVSIRYFYYEKSLYYVLDRFLYGGLLVMLITLVAGAVFYLLNKKGIKY